MTNRCARLQMNSLVWRKGKVLRVHRYLFCLREAKPPANMQNPPAAMHRQITGLKWHIHIMNADNKRQNPPIYIIRRWVSWRFCVYGRADRPPRRDCRVSPACGSIGRT